MVQKSTLQLTVTLSLAMVILLTDFQSSSAAKTTPKPRQKNSTTFKIPDPPPTPAKPPPTKLSSGLFAQELTSGPRLYESYAALTFDFELPAQPNNLTMVFDYDCPTSEFTSAKFSCPIFYYLHKIRDKLRPTIELKHLRHPETSSKSAFNIPSCDELAKHFHTTTMSSIKFQEYTQLLQSCVDNLIVKSPLNTKYGSEALKQKLNDYSLLIHGFVENFFQFLPRGSRVDKAVLLNTLLSTNSLGFTQHLQEAQMWTEALHDCEVSSRIPSQLIGPEDLKLSLLKLQHLVKQKNQDFVIPLTNGSISEYYSAPLADCVMTKEALHVRVLIPIKEVKTDWKMYSLTSIPFVYNDGGDGTRLICAVKEQEDAVYAFEQSSNRSFVLNSNNNNDCDVRNDGLCHVGKSGLSLSLRNAKKNCASVTLMNQVKKIPNPNISHQENDDMTKYCDLHCESMDKFTTPILVKVASDRFYIVGQNTESIIVSCAGQVEILLPPEEGAMEIVLPCGCQIMYNSHRFVSQEPCWKTGTGNGGRFAVSIVKPIHLAKVTVVEKEVIEEMDEQGNHREFVSSASDEE